MDIASLVQVAELKDAPLVWMTLPYPLRVGDTLLLDFTLRRRKGTRTEELKVQGEYKVLTVLFDLKRGRPRQGLVVEAKGLSPSWKAIRSTPLASRSFRPAKAPKTVVG